MKQKINIFLLFILISSCSKETILNNYRAEVSALKTEIETDAYWDHLLELDQEALKNGKYTIEEHDSISLTHMIRTALMFEIHGNKSYKFNNVVPEMHLTHNNYGASTLAFWPIIKRCIKIRGDAKITQYPAYQLETVANNFYGYSVYSQTEKQDFLLKKLNLIDTNIVSEDLLQVFNQQQKINTLEQINVIGIWQSQPFKTMKEFGFFEFVRMSDDNIYYKRNERLQKLEIKETEAGFKFYKIENEPFGWFFKLDKNGDLSLFDDNENEVLINYSKYKI